MDNYNNQETGMMNNQINSDQQMMGQILLQQQMLQQQMQQMQQMQQAQAMQWESQQQMQYAQPMQTEAQSVQPYVQPQTQQSQPVQPYVQPQTQQPQSVVQNKDATMAVCIVMKIIAAVFFILAITSDSFFVWHGEDFLGEEYKEEYSMNEFDEEWLTPYEEYIDISAGQHLAVNVAQFLPYVLYAAIFATLIINLNNRVSICISGIVWFVTLIPMIAAAYCYSEKLIGQFSENDSFFDSFGTAWIFLIAGTLLWNFALNKADIIVRNR